MVGFCGSRALPCTAEVSALVADVVGSVLSGGRWVAVGCATGGDALVLSSALAAGASSRVRVFAAFGPASPLPALLPPFPRSPAWPRPSQQAPPSRGGVGEGPRFPWQPGLLRVRRPSSRRSPPRGRAVASSGSSP